MKRKQKSCQTGPASDIPLPSGPILTLGTQASGESAHQINDEWIESDGSIR